MSSENLDLGGVFVIGLVIGLIVGFTATGLCLQNYYESTLTEHGCGQYNSITAEFEYINNLTGE